MNIIREILLWVEDQPPELLRTIGVPDGISAEVAVGHIRLMADAGLFDGRVDIHGPDQVLIAIHGLSNEGHDLLDAIRSDQVWEKTQEKIKEVGGSVAIDTLKAVATGIAAKLLGF